MEGQEMLDETSWPYRAAAALRLGMATAALLSVPSLVYLQSLAQRPLPTSPAAATDTRQLAEGLELMLAENA